MRVTRKSSIFTLFEVAICLAVIGVFCGVSLKGCQTIRRYLDYWNRTALAIAVTEAFEAYYEYYGKHANVFPKNKWFDLSEENRFTYFMGVMSDRPPIGANPERIEFYRPTDEQRRTKEIHSSIYIYLKDEHLDRCANPILQLSNLLKHSVPAVHGEAVLWFVPRR